MIAVDTNLLVYAHRRDASRHREAAAVLRDLAEGRAAWAVPWPVVHEFVAVVTSPRIYRPPTSPGTALDAVEAWRASPSVVLLGEPPGYWPEFRAAVESGRARGGRVHDARIAALCRAHGVRELWSADRDFSRFPGIPVRNPLEHVGR